jgi:putative transposase
LAKRLAKEGGVSPGVRRLFVIDGSKALRAGIDAVYGESNPVQRCRNHKIRNVEGYLPAVKRWVVSSLLDGEKKFRRISGCKDIWMLEAALTKNIDIQKKRA